MLINAPKKPEQFLSLKKAAGTMDVSVSTLRRGIKAQALPAYKILGQIRIALSDLQTFIDGSHL